VIWRLNVTTRLVDDRRHLHRKRSVTNRSHQIKRMSGRYLPASSQFRFNRQERKASK
jgi:hypothetical protein